MPTDQDGFLVPARPDELMYDYGILTAIYFPFFFLLSFSSPSLLRAIGPSNCHLQSRLGGFIELRMCRFSELAHFIP